MDDFTRLVRGKFLGVFNSVWLMILFALIPAFLLTRSTFGRRVFSVGGNEEAADLASFITSSRVALGQATASDGMEMQAIAAVILCGTSIYGGQGAIWRSLAGVFLLALVNNGFNILSIDPFFRDLTMGLIILAAVGISAMGQRHRPGRRVVNLVEIARRASSRPAARPSAQPLGCSTPLPRPTNRPQIGTHAHHAVTQRGLQAI